MNDNETREAVAGRLRTARELAGLSQAQVAHQLGVHRPTVTEIEAGRRRVAAEELAQLAELYEVDVNWLLGFVADGNDSMVDRVQLAAREIGKLKPDDFDRVMDLLGKLRGSESN